MKGEFEMRLPNQSRSVRSFTSIKSKLERAIYPSEVAQYINPFDPGDLHYCYGWDENTNSCKLYLGSKRLCDSLTPCDLQKTYQVVCWKAHGTVVPGIDCWKCADGSGHSIGGLCFTAYPPTP
jgi:hypothetical protein